VSSKRNLKFWQIRSSMEHETVLMLSFDMLRAHFSALDSMHQHFFPSCFKDAFLTPICKKSGPPASDPSSRRPISNLSVMSKLLECLVAKQLTSFLLEHQLLPPQQSGFRAGFSTESAITKVLSDLLDSVDRGNTAPLALFDLSATFYMVDHDILLNRLFHVSFGISGSYLSWCRSYLSDRRQSIRCSGVSSSQVDLVCDLPHGSSLGPIVFLLYTGDLPSVVTAHGLSVHLYADDSQIYGSCRPECTSALSSSLVFLLKLHVRMDAI
jgi:Reverse transcriptase (RNA-dependent DNA polymerase)